jgi:transcriptional antiterminator RfaH
MMRWYVIRSKHQNEDLLWQQLRSRGVEVYYPCIHTQFVKSRARKIKPYFPSYLFVHVDMDAVGTSTLQWIPGATGLVCFGGEPAWVSDGILQAIRGRVDQINMAGKETSQNLKSGDDIVIHSGPFAGYKGIFDSYLSDHERVMVFLKFIQNQQVRVKLPVDQIASKKQCRTRL